MTTFRGPRGDVARAAILRMAEESVVKIAARTNLAPHRTGALYAPAGARADIRFLTGTLDAQALFDLARTAASVTPHGRAIRLDGVGHFALLEDPQACRNAPMIVEDPPI